MEWSNTEEPRPCLILYLRPVKTTWIGVKPTMAGLVNLGNSCFLNASVQAVLHLPSLIEFLEEDKNHRTQCYKTLDCLMCSLYRTYLNMSLHSTFRPVGLFNLLPRIHGGFVRGKQEDAHEFLTFLLSLIEDHLIDRCSSVVRPDYCSQQTTAIGQIFSCWMKTNDTCSDCDSSRTTYAPVSLITLPVEAGSVQQALSRYVEYEEVISDFACSKNCYGRKCIRTIDFHTYPKVIRLVFTRFDNNGLKIKDPVTVERSVWIGKATYHFASCIIHEGNYSNEGHYTCLAVRPDGKLRHYDDAIVTENRHHLGSKETETGIYIAFYQLHHFKTDSLKRSPPSTPSKATSPLHKKIHLRSPHKSIEKKKKGKMLIFSPGKLKRKLGDIFRNVMSSTKKPKDNSDEEILAQPIIEVKDNSEYAVPTLTKPLMAESVVAPVPPIKISWKPRTAPKSMDSQSSNEYALVSSNHITAVPLPSNSGVASNGAAVEKNSCLLSQKTTAHSIVSSVIDQPLKDSDSEATADARVTPIKLSLRTKSNQHPVTPLKISWKPRETAKSTESQSSHEYTVAKKDPKVPTETAPQGFPSDFAFAFNVVTSDDQQNYVAMDNEPCTMNLQPDPDLPFVPVQLCPEDVPEANLPNKAIEKNSLQQLRRWLEFRGIPTKGNKKQLIEKIQNCINSGQHMILDPKVDGGKHYNDKRQQIQLTQDFIRLDDDDIFPSYGWGSFPSRDIPSNFNFGSVYHYLVETMPSMEEVIHLSGGDSSGDEEVEDVVEIADPFEEGEGNEIKSSKKLRRGLQYVKSKYIRSVQDSLPDRIHVYKGLVRASMRGKAYLVKVAISQVSGSVVRCCCDVACPQRSLGRCSHISALLLYILLHKNLNGSAAIMCTSKPCTWNRGSLKHNPSIANQKQYDSFHINVLRRANYDPRATRVQTRVNVTYINSFLCSLSYKEKDSLFQTVLTLQYEDFKFDNDDIKIFRTNRKQLYDALKTQLENKKPSLQHVGALEVKETKTQSATDNWLIIRALHCSAQPSHQIAHFREESAKMKFLQKHLWGINRITTKAMAYGKRHESDARKQYADDLLTNDPTAIVHEHGLFLHTDLVGLSCSPDGIKESKLHIHPRILLEIKILYCLRNEDPNQFEEHLSKKQLNAFFLKKGNGGNLELKKNHAYYDQIQFSMGLLNLPECDFFVWTKKGSLTVTVPFDEERWLQLRESLTTFHWEYLLPEYFTMRTPRNLVPTRIE